MSRTRSRWNLALSCINLIAGTIWLWVALRHFDRLSLLNGYHLPEYRGRRPHGGDVFLPVAVGLAFLISAAVGFISWMRRSNGDSRPAIITLSGSKPL